MIKEKEYQLQIKEFQVKFQKKILKILTLYPALNDTFVFHGMHATGKDFLVHCDKNGNILYEYKFTHSVDSLGMVELHKVTILEPRLNQIHIFNLQTHQKCELNFQFMFEQSDQSNIITFSQTRLICVVQNGRYNDSRLRLTYFNSNISSQSQPVAVYESDSEWVYDYIIKKGNQNSMIIWYKPRQDDKFQIKQFHLEDVNPKFNFYTCPNTLGQPYGKEKLQISILTAWQMNKSQFCLVCVTQKSNYNHESSEIVNNNFIWNIATNTIRQTKFTFNQQYSQFLIDIYSIGKFSVFHTYSFHNGNAEISPIYYVNNGEQKLMPIQREWSCTYLTKYFFPSYKPSLYVQCDYQNGNVESFKMKIIQIVEKPE